MLLTLMEEWGILGREGSCTATARYKGCRLQSGASWHWHRQRLASERKHPPNALDRSLSLSRFLIPSLAPSREKP
jgi:hypothetical protein